MLDWPYASLTPPRRKFCMQQLLQHLSITLTIPVIFVPVNRVVKIRTRRSIWTLQLYIPSSGRKKCLLYANFFATTLFFGFILEIKLLRKIFTIKILIIQKMICQRHLGTCLGREIFATTWLQGTSMGNFLHMNKSVIIHIYIKAYMTSVMEYRVQPL